MATHADPTFQVYKTGEAVEYGETRTSYPPQLYNQILQHHERTNGEFICLLDVGCGPGNATRDLSPYFDNAIGVDPGEEMINTAKRLGGKDRTEKDILFAVCPAESCASALGVEIAGVDLLISAMAAHWFDMRLFWEQAARVVKPNGTVALWTISSLYAHPDTPNAAEVNRLLLHLEREVLAPYEALGNRISRDMYDNLDMPWTSNPGQEAFLRDGFVKHEWDREGVLSNGKDFFGETEEMPLAKLEKALGTASMVTRWRAAHPDLVNTDQDCVKALIERLKPLLKDGKFKCCGSTAMLFFKRTLTKEN